eukprot:g6245.t1
MPELTQVRKDAFDAIRDVHFEVDPTDRKAAEAERLQYFFNNTQELLEFPDGIDERLQFELRKPDHIKSINEVYMGHGPKFPTQRSNPWLWNQLLQQSDYLDFERREMIFSKDGFLNTGFLVEGEVPRYGAWDGRAVSDEERTKYEAIAFGDRDFRKLIRKHIRVLHQPEGVFHDEDVMRRGFDAVNELMDGVLAYEQAEEDMNLTRFIVPIFSIGQRLQEDGTCAKVRPIANEKRRSLALSPLAEHMTLPSIPHVIDGFLYAANPKYTDPFSQAKKDVLNSIETGRQAKKKGKLAWTEVANLPLPVPPSSSNGFVPVVETAQFHETIDLLGIDCTPTPEGAYFSLSKKKKDRITKEIGTLVELLEHWEHTRANYTDRELIRNLQKAQLPEVFKNQNIQVYELIAVAMAQRLFSRQLKRNNSIIHVDNAGAVWGIAKGMSSHSLSSAVIYSINEFQCTELEDSLPLYAYVATNANPADACTRFAYLQKLIDSHHTQFTFSRREMMDVLFQLADEAMRAEQEAAQARQFGLATTFKPTKEEKRQGKITNRYGNQTIRIEQFNELPPDKRSKIESIVPRQLACTWPLRDHSVVTIWPDEDFYLRSSGMGSRNSKWKLWMFWTKNNMPKAFFEPDKYHSRAQADWLRAKRPNVLWAEVQAFGCYLLDCDYSHPEHYASLVGQRLRGLNALERGNTMAQSLMSQTTIYRLKRLGVEWSRHGAFPPNLSFYERLSLRQKRIFELWMATGLRPRSLMSLRNELVEQTEGSQMCTLRVPFIKINPTPGEMFIARVPKAVFSTDILPITRSDLEGIAKTLGASLYGPRRALAIYLRLRVAELGVKPLLPDGKVDPVFVGYKREVCKWMGWSATSTMWEKVYSADAFEWRKSGFQIHPLVRSYFDSLVLDGRAVKKMKPCITAKKAVPTKKKAAAPKRRAARKANNKD